MKNILKVLRDMLKDGITSLLVFISVVIVSLLGLLLVLMPAICIILLFGKECGANLVLLTYIIPIILLFVFDFIDKFRRRLSEYK